MPVYIRQLFDSFLPTHSTQSHEEKNRCYNLCILLHTKRELEWAYWWAYEE